MTQLDALYRYGVAPSERVLLALNKTREVYGIRSVVLREADKTVRVEYDASRLTGAVIHHLLLGTGLDIVQAVPGVAQRDEAASVVLA